MPTDTVISALSRPGRPGLSFETYEQAYHELCAEDGSPPSQRQLRKYLGTGSNTTLAGYRRRIAEEFAAAEKPPEPRSVDAELLATVQRLATQIALDEAQVADDRVEQLQKEAENRIRIAETTMEKRLRDTAVLEHRATSAEKDLAELRAALKEKEAALLSSVATIQALKADNDTLNQSLTNASSQIESQTRELSQRDKALSAAHQAEKTANLEATAEKTALQEALAKAQTDLTSLSENHAGLSARFDERNVLTETQNRHQQALQSRLEQSVEKHEATLIQLNDVKAECESLSLQCGELTTELQSEKRSHALALERFEIMRTDQVGQIEHLQQTVTALSNHSSR